MGTDFSPPLNTYRDNSIANDDASTDSSTYYQMECGIVIFIYPAKCDAAQRTPIDQ